MSSPPAADGIADSFVHGDGKGEKDLHSPADSHIEKAMDKKTNQHGIILEPQPSDDPRDPLNWSTSKKTLTFFIILFATFTGISSAVANVLSTPQQAASWGVTATDATYSISAVLAGIVVGPILLVPLVRVFGVMSCNFWSIIAVVLTSIWSSLSTGSGGYSSFIASRAVAGVFTSTPQVFISGIITDIYFLHQRGKAFAIYSTVYMVATVAGPTFGGFIVQYTDWTVCFWWTVGANALAAILLFLFADDTAWDRDNQRPVTDKQLPKSWIGRRFALYFPGTKMVPHGSTRHIGRSLLATLAIGFSPMTVITGVYTMIQFSWFIMAGVQVPVILQEPNDPANGVYGFGFSSQSTAFFYFTAWIGAILGVIYGVLVNDRLPLYLQKVNKGVWKTEYRLQPTWFPAVIGPIGCGLFGAAVYYHTHWIVLAVGECMIVFSAVTSVPASSGYVIEYFRHYGQETATALNAWRIVFAVAVQFFYTPWTEAVGVQWVWGTAAFISIAIYGLIILLMFQGPKIARMSLWNDERGVVTM